MSSVEYKFIMYEKSVYKIDITKSLRSRDYELMNIEKHFLKGAKTL